jgi:starvation-inducible DNA-binding protein
MKTLDYLHLNEKKVADVVSALHQLLADFQVHYTNLRGFHWDIKGHGFFVLHGKFEDMYNDAAENCIVFRISKQPKITRNIQA